MAYNFDQIFAADPANPSNIARNAAITIFAPGDGAMTPLSITDPSGAALSNPVPVNANGFGSAFIHETLDRVAWAGGGFTGFFTSYEGIKNEAVAAREAAETAAANAGADAAAELAARIAAGDFQGAPGIDGATVLPTDVAIANAINGAGTATKTALEATFAKVTVPGLSFSEKLTRWYEKVMKAHRTQTSIAFFGHSIVSGSYANNDGTFTTDTEATRYYSIAPQLAAKFAQRFGDPGVGFLWAADLPGLSYVLAGGAAKSQASSSQGFGHYRFTIPTGGTVSISNVKATKIRLHYLGNQPAASVTVDGGAPVSLPQAADADGLYTVTIPDLVDKAHSVVVSGPATGTCYLTGIEFLRKDSGIPVHRFGWSGKVAADAFGWAAPAGTTLGNLSTAAKDRQIQSVTTRLNVGLAIIMFDANDVNLGYPIYGLTPTTLQTQIQQLVDKIKLLSPDTDILLVTGPQKDPASFTQPYTQAQFAQAYYNVAAATANVAHLDLLALWGTYAEANAKGLYYDTIHPNLEGHADLGNTLYRALSPRAFHLPNF